MTHSILPFLTIATALLTSISAQADIRVDTRKTFSIGRVPIHTAAPDSGVEYGIWAATDSYKVSFHGDMTFVPYLGSAYPQNMPLTWRTQGVSLGQTQLLAPGAAGTRQHSAFRYERRFGDVTEAYDVLENGLEQTFVIHARPHGHGDLVVHGRITTPLRADAVDDLHQEIVFTDEADREVIRYGAVVAIDAVGRRIAATTTFDAGDVRLRVPADWIASATFPVVVDPLLTRTTLSVGAAPSSMDVVRDESGDDLMVVLTRGVSASDQDLLALMTTDAWGSAAVVFSDVNTWNTPIAKLATAGNPRKYCLVFERQLPQHRVRAHLHDSGDFTQGTSVVSLEPAAGNHDWRPDVGGQVLSTSTFTPTGGKFLIVFQRDFTGSNTFTNTNTSLIYGRTLDANGTLDAEFPIAISVLEPVDHEWPSVNQQGKRIGSAQSRSDWLVVFQRYSGPGATWRVRGKLVRDDGSLTLSTWTPSADSSASHHLTPRVAGHSGRYLVTFVQSPFSAVPFKTTSTSGHSLRSERVDWPAGGTPTNYAERTLEAASAANLGLGDVAYDDQTISHWAITYHADRAAGGSGRAHIVRTGYQGLLTESQVLYDPTSASEQGLAGGVCFDSENDDFVAFFGRRSGTSGQFYGNKLGYRSVTGAVVSGVSCSSALIAWAGSQQIGSEFGSVRLSAAPANAAAFLILSVASVDINLSFLGMNGCRLLVDNFGAGYLVTLDTMANGSGSASISLPLPESLPAATVFCQWLHTDIGANPLNLVTTQRVRIDFVK